MMTTPSPTRGRRPWRVRRCPQCQTALYGGELIQITYGANWYGRGLSKRRCPRCFFTGTTEDFVLIRDARMEREEREQAVRIEIETPIQVSVLASEPAAVQLSFPLPVSRKAVD